MIVMFLSYFNIFKVFMRQKINFSFSFFSVSSLIRFKNQFLLLIQKYQSQHITERLSYRIVMFLKKSYIQCMKQEKNAFTRFFLLTMQIIIIIKNKILSRWCIHCKIKQTSHFVYSYIRL